MNYDEQINGLVEELLNEVTERSINMEEIQKKLLELNQKIDEQQDFEREVETRFLADLQFLINQLNYSEVPEVRETARKLIRLIYQHRLKYAQIRYLEESIG
jgi:hypothetical protein